MRWLFVIAVADRDVVDEFSVVDRQPVAQILEVIDTVGAVHGEHQWWNGYQVVTGPTVTVNGRLFQRFHAATIGGGWWWTEPGAIADPDIQIVDDDRLVRTARLRRCLHEGRPRRADLLVEDLVNGVIFATQQVPA